MALLKSRGVGVSHNPESKHEARQRHRAVKAYLAADVAIGLGRPARPATTTSTCSNDAHRIVPAEGCHVDPTTGQRETAVQMATIGARGAGHGEA